MPQAIPLATTALAIKLGAPWYIQVLAYLGGAIISGQLMPSESPTIPISTQAIRTNARSAKEPLKVVYGKCRVGGNDVFIETVGESNKYLWVVQTLSEGECEGIDTYSGAYYIYLGETLIANYPEESLTKVTNAEVSWWFYPGTNTQACGTGYTLTNNSGTNILEAIPSFEMAYHNTCYIIWRFKYDSNVFSSLPERTVVLKGRKLYDFRDPPTTVYSTNPALILYDYLTNNRYGMGIDPARIDETTWESVANYCGTKGWNLNLPLYSDNKQAGDILAEIKKYFRGAFGWGDGKILLRYADLYYESPVMTITDEYLIRDDSGKHLVNMSQMSGSNKPDGLMVTYTAPDMKYALDEFPLGEDTGTIQNVDLSGFCSREKAGNMGTYLLERRRLNRIFTGVFVDELIQLEPFDPVIINSDLLGFQEQYMRVSECNIQPNGEVEISFLYEDFSLYNDKYNADIEETYSTTISSPADDPPNVINVSFGEEIYWIKDRSYVCLKISWDIPNYYPFMKHVEVWASKDNITYTHCVNTTLSADFRPTEEAEVWYFKFRIVNTWNKRLDLSTVSVWIHAVVGETDYPSDPEEFYALVAEDKVRLTWLPVEWENILTYVLRYGSNWESSFLLFEVDATFKSITGIKPGQHRIYLAAKSSMGKYSQTPPYVDFTVHLPLVYVDTSSGNDTYAGGSHSGTEVYNDPVYGDVLRVNRSTTKNLEGYWESGEHDLGSDQRIKVWIDFINVSDNDIENDWEMWFYEGETMTWEDLFASEETTWYDVDGGSSGGGTWRWLLLYSTATKWSDVLSSGETWSSNFQSQPAGTLRLVLLYKEDGGGWKQVNRFEIMCADVVARYFKYQVHLTDYSPNSRIMIDGECEWNIYSLGEPAP